MILTRFSKKDFDEILENYNIGRYKSHKHIPIALEHTVYLLKTDKGKFILKIYEEVDLKSLKQEIEAREFLRKKGLPIPEIMKTKSKKNLLKYKNANLTIEQFVKGKGAIKFNKKMAISTAETMALMHKELQKKKIKWIREAYHFELHEEDTGKIQKIMNLEFREEENKFLEESKKINKKKLKRSIIHADFQDVNLLFKNNKIIAILDWADMHKSFLVYDIAVTMARSFIKATKIEKEKIKFFLKTYQKQIKLNSEEKKAIYYLMKHRLLGTILWCYVQAKKHKDQAKALNKWMKEVIKHYRTLDKFPLKDFLRLF